MTVSDIINPLCWDLIGVQQQNNPYPFESPAHFMQDIFWWALIRDNNPVGDMPINNPTHYINPLSGNYTNGPLEF